MRTHSATPFRLPYCWDTFCGGCHGHNIEFMETKTEIKVAHADGVKCPRCWHWHMADLNFGHTPEDIVADPKLASEHLCNKCVGIILEHFPHHASVPFILDNLKARGIKWTDNPEYLVTPQSLSEDELRISRKAEVYLNGLKRLEELIAEARTAHPEIESSKELIALVRQWKLI